MSVLFYYKKLLLHNSVKKCQKYLLLKILSSHKWVTLGIALFTTQSWAITSVSGKVSTALQLIVLNELTGHMVCVENY